MADVYLNEEDPAYRDLAKTAVLDDGSRREYHLTRVVFEWSADRSRMLEHCSADPLEPLGLGGGGLMAVYVIAADDRSCSKIGITLCPKDRLDGLQSANWDKLKVRYVLWVWEDRAKEVEQLALATARAIGVEARREWVALEPEDAFQLVIDSAKTLGVEAGSHLAVKETRRMEVASRSHAMRAAAREAEAEKAKRLGWAA